MELEAKVIQELPLQSGTSKAGKPWKKREWVVETFGQYPRKVKIQAFGDRSDSMNVEPGKDYAFGFDLESREFNGRWYTDVSIYSVREIQPNQGYGQGPQTYQQGGYPQQAPYGAPAPGYQQPAPQNFGAPAAPAAPSFDSAPANGDDLPF